MSRLFNHLGEIVETANGGFDITPKGRQYFSRFLRQHGKALGDIKTHAGLIDALHECNTADFAAARQRMHITLFEDEGCGAGFVGNESLHRMVA